MRALGTMDYIIGHSFKQGNPRGHDAAAFGGCGLPSTARTRSCEQTVRRWRRTVWPQRYREVVQSLAHPPAGATPRPPRCGRFGWFRKKASRRVFEDQIMHLLHQERLQHNRKKMYQMLPPCTPVPGPVRRGHVCSKKTRPDTVINVLKLLLVLVVVVLVVIHPLIDEHAPRTGPDQCRWGGRRRWSTVGAPHHRPWCDPMAGRTMGPRRVRRSWRICSRRCSPSTAHAPCEVRRCVAPFQRDTQPVSGDNGWPRWRTGSGRSWWTPRRGRRR